MFSPSSQPVFKPSQNFGMLGVLKVCDSCNEKKSRFNRIVYCSALIQQVILENLILISMYTDCGELCVYHSVIYFDSTRFQS